MKNRGRKRTAEKTFSEKKKILLYRWRKHTKLQNSAIEMGFSTLYRLFAGMPLEKTS